MLARFVLLLALVSIALSRDIVPGLEAIQTGYDAVKGEGNLSPVFKFNYSSGKTFYNSLNKQTYSVPDEVDVSMLNHVGINAIQSVTEHYDFYMHQIYEASWFGINIGIPGYFALAFHYGKEMGEVHERLSDQMHAMANGVYNFEMYELVGTMPEFMELDDNFSTFLGALPAVIKTQDDQDLYNQFIGAFGTHISYRNVLGGRCHLNTYLHQDYLMKKDSKWVATQLSFSFQYSLYKIGFGYFHNKTDIHVDQDFTQNSEQSLYFYGGNPAYQSEGAEVEWLSSVPEYPFTLNATLESIHLVIPDARVAQNVKDTIDYYVKNSFLPNTTVHHRLAAIGMSTSDPAYPPLPGTDTLGHGVDEANLGVPLKPVLDYTYNHGTVYQNPVYPDLKWSVPDQIPTVQDTPESLDMNGTFVFEEVQDFVQWTYHSSSSHGLFSSHSKEVVTFYERYYENDQSMSLILKEFAWYTIVLPPFPPPMPSAGLKAVLARMPTTYDSDYNKRLWDDFINVFGTAYYTKAVMGGSMKCQTWFHKCFLSEDSGKWVSEQSGWSVFGIIGGGHMKKEAETHIDKNFAEYHETEITFIGGDTATPTDHWQDWVATIKQSPSPVEYLTTGMETLFSGPYAALVAPFQAAKQAHMAAIAAANAAAAAKYAAQGAHVTPDWCHAK